MPEQILVVDDDELLRRSLAFTLEQAGYAVDTAASAEDALAHIQLHTPDLMLLDIGLPGMDGLEMLRAVQHSTQIPVIFVTARRRELDEVLGLELGAEDYITKPFSDDVLLAHIKAVIRRTKRPALPQETQPLIAVGDIEIDPSGHTVKLNGQTIDLAPRAFELLRVMALQPGKVLSTDYLLAQVWGAEYLGEPQVVYVHIRWLREKLEDDPSNPRRIVTVRGVGYKLMPE